MYQKPPSVLKSLKLLLFSLFGEKTINRGELKKKKKKKGGLKVIARDSVRRTSPKIVELDKIE